MSFKTQCVLIALALTLTIVNSSQNTKVNLDIFNEVFKDGLLNQMADYLQKNPAQNALECFRDILEWMTSITQLQPWAFEMFDATAKIQSGILKLNLNSLGQYDQCLAINKTIKGRQIRGKYCLSGWRMLTFISGLVNLTRPLINHPLTDNLTQILRDNEQLAFNYGVCIPHTCRASEIQDLIRNVLQSIGINQTTVWVVVNEDYCDTSDKRELSSGAIVEIVIFSILGALLLFSTLYDLFSKPCKEENASRSDGLLKSFSIYKNFENLGKTKKSSYSLSCINGLRSISILWIILGHRYTVTSIFPIQNILDVLGWFDSYISTFVVSSTMGVDTFLVLSGLLLAYVFFNKHENKSSFNVGLFYVHRLFRLWPAMAAIILFSATLLEYIGDGPTWPYTTSIMADSCKDTWWSSLFYLSNYVRPESQCVPNLWYLGVDTQLYILSPILLFPLLKNKKIGVGNLIFWVVAQNILLITLSYTNDWPGVLNGDQNYMFYFYYATHTRATPWLLGFAAGYILHLYRKEKVEINKGIVLLLWIISFAILLACVLGVRSLRLLNHKINAAEDGTFNAFARTGWSLALIWLIFACSHGYGGPVNWFLSLKYWEIMGKLSYSMYLLHNTLQYWFSGTARVVSDFNEFDMVYLYFGDIVITILVSLLWVLTFEMPFIEIEKAIFFKSKPLIQPVQAEGTAIEVISKEVE